MTETTKPLLYVAMVNDDMRTTISEHLTSDYIIMCFDDLDSLTAAVSKTQPSLILCHQDLIDHEQTVILGSLKTASPVSKILVIGPRRPIEIQIEALKHGARGYFDSSLPVANLHEALQRVLHGEVWVERHVISGLIDELTHIPEISEQQRQAVASLSPKELEVANLVSHGATNKMIAKNMDITERTVKAHLTTIFHKMAISDRLSLAIFFRDLR